MFDMLFQFTVVYFCECAYVCYFYRLFGPSLGVMYYNNLGVIHMGLGKPTLACLYLQKALKEAQVDDDANQSGILTLQGLTH